jgi:vancomycin aglycone glucosyltransferase
MRILLSTYGSRGDVQPVAALALALQELGVDVRLCAPPDPEFGDLFQRTGLPFIPAFSSITNWIAYAKHSGMALPQLAAVMVTKQYEVLHAAADGCDAILATGLFPSLAAAQATAEKRGIPYVSAHFCPRYLPSHHHAPVEFPGWKHPPDLTDNRALWDSNNKAINGLFGEAVNSHRVAVGLPAFKDVRDPVFAPRLFLATDPTLGPWEETSLCDAIPTGAWLLEDERPLPDEVEAFLQAGLAPVYVGFGSIALASAADMASAAVSAGRAMGRRTILFRGRAELGLPDTGADCMSVGEINHHALFPRVAAVVHHGGAGTTLAAARAGAPQVIVPQVADQPYWASRVAALGIGAAHPGPAPTQRSLENALEIALAATTVDRARAIATSVQLNGATMAARLLARLCS